MPPLLLLLLLLLRGYPQTSSVGGLPAAATLARCSLDWWLEIGRS